MTEDPRGRGYPDLAKPQKRVTDSWRQMWTQLLVRGPKQARAAQQAVRSTRQTLARKRR